MNNATPTRRLDKFNRMHEGDCLCPEHADYFEMPEGTYEPVASTNSLGLDDPIECDVCSMAAMRRAGAI